MKKRKVSVMMILTLSVLLQALGVVPTIAASGEANLSSAVSPAPQTETVEPSILQIYSGFEGQETSAFQLLAEYTIEDLEQMELMEEDYTLLDQEAGVFVCHALGVRLQEILEHAGIETEDIENLAFQTEDGRCVEIDIGTLLEDPRYCFYDLPELYDSETGKIKGEKNGLRQKVLTMIAWQELWFRASDYPLEELNELWEQAEDMDGEHAFRLLFGQREIDEDLADHALAEVTKIIAFQKGSPPVTDTPEAGNSETQGEGDRNMSAGEAAASEPRTDGEETGSMERNPQTAPLTAEPVNPPAEEEQPSLTPEAADPAYQQILSPETDTSADQQTASPGADTSANQQTESSGTDTSADHQPASPEADISPGYQQVSPAPVTSAVPGTADEASTPRSAASTTKPQVTEWELREIKFGPSGASDLTPVNISPQERSSRSRPHEGGTDSVSRSTCRRTWFLLFGMPFLMGGLIESIYVWWSYGSPDRLKSRR